MPIRFFLTYTVLAGASVLLSFVEPFTGIGVFRALPTALLAAAALRHTRARFGLWIVLAVALGSAGDFFLASQSRAGFIPGLVSFLIGHLFYLRAFARELSLTWGRTAVLSGALATLLVLIIAIIRNMVHNGELALLAPVLLYSLVLATTMAVCLAHRSPTPWIAAGGVVFVLSDAHIAVNYMLLDTPLLPIIISGYTTYYLAQILLVHGAAQESAAADSLA